MSEVYLGKEHIRKFFSPRAANAEKRDFGHVLLAGGSYGMIGAVTMSAGAALRSGAGLVTVLAPRCGYTILQSAVPEAMVLPTKDEEHLHTLPDIHFYKQVAAGSGLGVHHSTTSFIQSLLSVNRPLILDADALNIIAHNQWQTKIPKGSLITPNIREFNRLFAEHLSGNTLLDIQKERSQELGIYILLKGSGTTVTFPNGTIYHNTTGNPGMAKGGSGDVLTGMILGLWGRLNDLEKATLAGVYLHGLAGDIAAEKFHPEGMLPTDTIACISDAFFRLLD